MGFTAPEQVQVGAVEEQQARPVWLFIPEDGGKFSEFLSGRTLCARPPVSGLWPTLIALQYVARRGGCQLS